MKLEQARIETNDVYSIQRHCYRIHHRNHAIPLLEGSIQFSNQLRATSKGDEIGTDPTSGRVKKGSTYIIYREDAFTGSRSPVFNTTIVIYI